MSDTPPSDAPAAPPSAEGAAPAPAEAGAVSAAPVAPTTPSPAEAATSPADAAASADAARTAESPRTAPSADAVRTAASAAEPAPAPPTVEPATLQSDLAAPDPGAPAAQAPSELPGAESPTKTDAPLGLADAAKAGEDAGPPPFFGLGLDATFSDGSGLVSIGENYRNDLGLRLDARWSAGARLLRGGPFEKLVLAARFEVARSLSGVDDAAFGPAAMAGPMEPCSPDLVPSSNGTLDPTRVAYCHPAANARRTDYSDLTLVVSNPGIWRVPALGVALSPSLKAIVPLSLQSRYATLRFAFAPGLGLSRGFVEDRLRLGYALTFTKYLHAQTTPRLAPGGVEVPAGSNPYDGAAGAGLSNLYADASRTGSIGGYNTSRAWSHAFTAAFEATKSVSLEAMYARLQGVAYAASCAATLNGQALDLCANGDAVAAASGATVRRPGVRDTQIFSLGATYQPLDWLGVSLTWMTWSPLQHPDSSYRQPFVSVDYNSFTTVSLATTVAVEKLAAPPARAAR